MATSLLQSFVGGTRAMLAAQLVISVGAMALAGWTLSVTNQLIRERDRLQERVIQLEENIAARGEIPPPPSAVAVPIAPQDPRANYPGSIEGAAPVVPEAAAPADGAAPVPADPASPTPADPRSAQNAERATEAATEAPRDLGAIVGSLIGPAPPLRTVVLHVRSREEEPVAAHIARALHARAEGVRVLIHVMPPGDARQSGYAYFDGRQSRAAADFVARFHDAARGMRVAQWSAQLRGIALPAQGEYTADRLDIVLPPLPPPPAPAAAVAVEPSR
jgi:hypothetical protein